MSGVVWLNLRILFDVWSETTLVLDDFIVEWPFLQRSGLLTSVYRYLSILENISVLYSLSLETVSIPNSSV